MARSPTRSTWRSTSPPAARSRERDQSGLALSGTVDGTARVTGPRTAPNVSFTAAATGSRTNITRGICLPPLNVQGQGNHGTGPSAVSMPASPPSAACRPASPARRRSARASSISRFGWGVSAGPRRPARWQSRPDRHRHRHRPGLRSPTTISACASTCAPAGISAWRCPRARTACFSPLGFTARGSGSAASSRPTRAEA